jgi:A/G-specific adenine glycosylase
MITEFSKILLKWYKKHARVLPWRGSKDAYVIWVSEIMLQQTRVEAVIPYYQRWMRQFPNLTTLAHATEQEALQEWEGLGYYSRARNMHEAARIIVDEYQGMLPQSRKELEKLPGIGKYTSAAIASIAFGENAAALDGNIKRVISRFFNMALPVSSPQGERELMELAQSNLPAGKAGDYNQALMDLGAMICLPKNPLCVQCPVGKNCQANHLGLQALLPNLAKRPKTPHHTVTAAVIRRDGQVLIALRPSKGLLGGMWEFPGGKKEKGETLEQCLEREIKEELGCTIQVGSALGIFNHAYTHFSITLHCFECKLKVGSPLPIEASEVRWVSPLELSNFPMGKADRMISRKIISATANG